MENKELLDAVLKRILVSIREVQDMANSYEEG